MRRVVYYVTSSLDGFIADPEGGVDWLSGAPETDYGYAEFYEGIDAVLLGRATYEQILGFGGAFPYADRPVFVFTSHTDLPAATDDVHFIDEDPSKFVARLKLQEGSTIWLGGGGMLADTLLATGMLDEVDLFVQPLVLGAGIPLFAGDTRRALELVGTKTWPGGLVELRYHVAKRWRSDAELGR